MLEYITYMKTHGLDVTICCRISIKSVGFECDSTVHNNVLHNYIVSLHF